MTRPSFVLATLITAGSLAAPLAARVPQQPLARYSTFAVDMANQSGLNAGVVEILVTRWSPDAERDRLLAVLLEKGPAALLEFIGNLPKAGVLRTPTSIGYELRYVHRTPTPDGGEEILILTDRPIGSGEAYLRPRSMEYPYTMIELKIGPNGKGEGKDAIATKILPNRARKSIILEQYTDLPVTLKDVTRAK